MHPCRTYTRIRMTRTNDIRQRKGTRLNDRTLELELKTHGKRHRDKSVKNMCRVVNIQPQTRSLVLVFILRGGIPEPKFSRNP
jgi:hypothetical protein